MIQKSLLYILAMGFIAIVLTACGGKGIDLKLDYSGTEEELVESFGKAMADATPEQQNILRERMPGILEDVVWLARKSNPAAVDAFVAKKNAEEFQRLSKMSVRELLVDQLGKRKNILDDFIKFKLKVESITIVGVTPKEIEEITPYTRDIEVDGVISIHNDSDNLTYSLVGCQLALVIDGKQMQMRETSRCEDKKREGWGVIKSKGGKATFEFGYRVIDIAGEDIKTFYDSLKDSRMKNIAWVFEPSKSSYITSFGHKRVIASESEKLNGELQGELQKITADLAVLKK